MNKFLIIALFACVAVAAAAPVQEDNADTESQAPLKPDDEQETANLRPEHKQFSEYCRASRDTVLSEISTTSNGLSSRVFAMFFNTAAQLQNEVTGRIETANSRISQQLAHPDADITPAADDVDQILVDAQSKIQQGESQPNALLTGVKAAASAVSQNVGAFVGATLEKIKSHAKIDNVAHALVSVCDKVTELEKQVQAQFEEAKAEIQGAENVQFQDVNCLTTGRISSIEGICRLANAISPVLPKLMAGRRRY